MEIGTLVKTKTNHMTARVNLPQGYGVVTKSFKGTSNAARLKDVVYVQWVDQPKPRPVNTVYLEVICK